MSVSQQGGQIFNWYGRKYDPCGVDKKKKRYKDVVARMRGNSAGRRYFGCT